MIHGGLTLFERLDKHLISLPDIVSIIIQLFLNKKLARWFSGIILA